MKEMVYCTNEEHLQRRATESMLEEGSRGGRRGGSRGGRRDGGRAEYLPRRSFSGLQSSFNYLPYASVIPLPWV